MGTLELIYKRLPHRVNRFQQELLYEDASVIVTTQKLKPSNPIVLDGVTVLDDGFTAVWFVFADLWHDVGKIYNLERVFTGYYCDIITPMRRAENHYEITDLFLDLWVTPEGAYQIQDNDEFEEAIANDWIHPDLASKARKALQNLIAEVESGVFPPRIAADWELTT